MASFTNESVGDISIDTKSANIDTNNKYVVTPNVDLGIVSNENNSTSEMVDISELLSNGIPDAHIGYPESSFESNMYVEKEPLEGRSSNSASAGGYSTGPLVSQGDYLVIDCDFKDVIYKFGGQVDHLGPVGYGIDPEGCGDYSRAYCLYIQTGKVPKRNYLSEADFGLERVTDHPKNRKKQAQLVYDLLSKGQPCVIHVNSKSGKGHWLCVVGVKEGVDRDSVTINDLMVIDPAGNLDGDGKVIGDNSAKVRPISEVPIYCTKGKNMTGYEPGYQVVHYDKK